MPNRLIDPDVQEILFSFAEGEFSHERCDQFNLHLSKLHIAVVRAKTYLGLETVSEDKKSLFLFTIRLQNPFWYF